MIELLSGETGDVNGDSAIPQVSPMIIGVWATDFGGGTVNLESSPDAGTTWIPITRFGTAITYTSNAVENISGLIARGMEVRATLTGSTTPSNVNASLYEYIL